MTEQPALFPNLRPTLPGCVHGIVSLDPPTVQCDGCGYEHSHRTLAIAVLCSGIEFNPRVSGGGPRLCRECRGGDL